MSTAHRPTWDPAQAKDVKGGSRQISARDIASHTKLKFRQPGQTATSDVVKHDLRAELLEAERAAREKKRKAEGKPMVEDEPAPPAVASVGDSETNKRRKLLQEALELDKDDDDESSDEKREAKGEGERKENGSDEDEDDDDESEEEDETAELLRELERIKRERAEEKERLEREQNAKTQMAREEEIATANPLLNLAAALGQNTGVSTTAPGTFAVKRRWDDDLIFKNQATNVDKPSGQFVNDLLRTEFHKKFIVLIILVCTARH
ncbi:Cwf15/Cwc15 cell cycle control protein [Fomitiporia mediterranea MF3/22]|uniref:Cwf15/Cwc15 cell cycle control protein n=1 Tax=Fomitiporia mediterranea (strain MF3/22) TaxID=694068 RepID=UPI0004408C38|nr:Cwf15/Cwc15 cell cycle control protein [Fomitiporia mediterranea MF3/22]EJD08352.1 Cwf15/Cwc15 cell cycle control protein [Fomitiporia mediterranea MF3/22]